MRTGETYAIESVSETGKPLQHTSKFVNQCGVVVRDNVSITVQEWNEPKKAVLVSVLSTRERKRIAGESLWNISFYLRNTTKSMNSVTRFRVDVRGGG